VNRRQVTEEGVVFPCGWILDQPSGEIRLYYGGADSCLALATAQLFDLLSYLGTCPAAAKHGGSRVSSGG
jgi:predicted GH43/DUF377 family glycosyl hydrolase